MGRRGEPRAARLPRAQPAPRTPPRHRHGAHEELAGAGLTALETLERAASVERLELSPLPREAVGALAGAILGRRPAATFVDRLHALSGGNPFYVEELLAARDAGEDGSGSLSLRLRDVLRARVAVLSADALALLRSMSVAARPVAIPFLSRASGLPLERLEAALREVLDDHLVVPATEGAATRYRFRHELLRAFVAAGLLPTESARLHAAAAQALVDDRDDPPSPIELATHWDAAGDVERAFEAHLPPGSRRTSRTPSRRRRGTWTAPGSSGRARERPRPTSTAAASASAPLMPPPGRGTSSGPSLWRRGCSP